MDWHKGGRILDRVSVQIHDAATRLNDIVRGDDASASSLRIRLLSLPMALDIICQGVIHAEEVWQVVYAFGVAVRAHPSQKSQRIASLPNAETFTVSTVNDGWLKMKKPPHVRLPFLHVPLFMWKFLEINAVV